jgi:hypothetical protein
MTTCILYVRSIQLIIFFIKHCSELEASVLMSL